MSLEDDLSGLYTNMLYDPRIVGRLSHGADSMGSNGEYYWGLADDEIFFLIKMLSLDGDDIGRTLVFADYLTRIPFGESGYAAFEDIAKEFGYAGAADWRFIRFADIIGNYSVSREALDEIKKYFDDYLCDEIRADKACDIARAVCRLNHSFEQACLKNVAQAEEAMMSSSDFLLDALMEGGTLSFGDLLAQAPQPEPLTDGEILILREMAQKH